MSGQLKVHLKIGEIEFEAEGSAEDVELQRKAFMTELLPEAVSAVIRTTNAFDRPRLSSSEVALIDTSPMETKPDLHEDISSSTSDLSRESLASYISKFGKLSDQDFVLFSAYFEEKKNGIKSFSFDSIREFYKAARRTEYSNISMLIAPLEKKGLIMPEKRQADTSSKSFVLTALGIKRVEGYVITPDKAAEKKTSSKRVRKQTNKQVSSYSNLCIDDLNIKKYPEVKSLATFKDQMLLVMYIVSTEGKGEYFGIRDISYLITDLWGIHSSENTIAKIFTRNKTWFKTETFQGGGVKRKLLEGGKDYIKKLIANSEQT
ncbi:MAG: hypothetical protein BGN88_02165 [Clostridiales bacterium 43-6]|nr:MAG: hypothetical protein BGN88_02165 [Clostridiales bacterium 43-6]